MTGVVLLRRLRAAIVTVFIVLALALPSRSQAAGLSEAISSIDTGP